MSTNPKHPIQPLIRDCDGTLRFKKNPIIRHLLDTHPSVNLNSIMKMHHNDMFSADDVSQFMQLIGYSHEGSDYIPDDVNGIALEVFNGSEDVKTSTIKFLEGRVAELEKSLSTIASITAEQLS